MMVRQIAEAQQEERRPYIIVDFEIEKRLVWIVVQNIGKTPARDVRITTAPEIIDGLNKKLSDTVFALPMRFFPPGKNFRNLLKTAPEMLSDGSPLEYKISIQYTGDERNKTYNEENIINLGFHINRVSIWEKDIDDVFSAVDNLGKQLESISKAVNGLSKRY